MRTMNSNCLISIKGLQKSFSGISVLRDINLEIKRGDVIAIIGSSGGGKSTLLRSLIKLEDVDRGEIIVDGDCLVRNKADGVEYAQKDLMRNIRLKFGMVFQDFALFPHMSILENIVLCSIKVLGMKKEKAFYEARKILKKVGLDNFCNSYPCQLSGGQKQRVAISRALVLNPEIVLFDEPTSALDPELAKEVLEVIKKLVVEENKTMMIVTHNMKFAENVANKVVFMDEGEIIEIGSPQEIFFSPKNSRLKKFLLHS